MHPENGAGLNRKIARNLLPLLMIGYIIVFIDRPNVSFAKLQMVGDLGLSEAAFGLGASLFFIGYLIFEVPSNLILVKFGPCRWLARIMVTWGLITVLLAFTPSSSAFYVLRFLLGVAEAGFYPGLLYLLIQWFPAAYRGRVISYFVLSSAIANMISGPLSGYLFAANGVLELRGWQWIFLVTGLPAIVVGILILRHLPDTPEETTFLSTQERSHLKQTLERERASMPPSHPNPLRSLFDLRVLALTGLFMLFTLSAYGFSYWLPTVVESFGVDNQTNGLLNVIPWLCVAAALYWVQRRPGRVDETSVSIVVPSIIGAGCFLASYYLPAAPLRFIALCGAAMCIFMAQPCFWTLPGRFLSGVGAAAAIAGINSVGNLGGFFGQTIVPLIRDLTGSIAAPLLFLATCLLCRGLLTILVVRAVGASSVAEEDRATG